MFYLPPILKSWNLCTEKVGEVDNWFLIALFYNNTLLLNEGIPRAYRGHTEGIPRAYREKKLCLKNILLLPTLVKIDSNTIFNLEDFRPF